MMKIIYGLLAMIVLFGSFIYWSIQTNEHSFSTQSTAVSSNNHVNTEKQELLPVPLVRQNPELNRGCEVTALTMFLNYFEHDVSKLTLAKKIKTVPYHKGDMYGNMDEGFIGNIYTFKEEGLGVNVGPIFKLGLRYMPFTLKNITGSDTDALYEALDEGSPVWVLTNTKHKKLPNSAFTTWETKKGPQTVTRFMHAAVLTGYDDNYVYLNDPLKDKPHFRVKKSNFEAAWIQMGRQALRARSFVL